MGDQCGRKRAERGARSASVRTDVLSAQPLGWLCKPTQGVSAMGRGGREAPIGLLLMKAVPSR